MYRSSSVLAGIGSVDIAIASGDQGIAQTIDAIRQLVFSGVRDLEVNRVALQIVSRAPAHDTEAEARAIYDWIRANIRFTNDIYGAETLRPAREILQVRAGDCDDINGVLLPTLLESVGIQSRLVTIAADQTRPEAFSHIYAEANLDGQWVPMDAAARSARFGLAPAVYWRKQVWEVTPDDSSMGAMGMYHLGQDDDGSSFDISDLTQLITAGTVGAANVIKAVNAPYAPTSTMLAAQPVRTSSLPPAVAVTSSGGSSAVLYLGGAAVLIMLVLAMRK
jgi:hypothetical protein